MNVTDQWMLERMQQMAANMAASLPQVGQSTDTSKPEKGDSFKDLMDKAKDTKVEDSHRKEERCRPEEGADTEVGEQGRHQYE